MFDSVVSTVEALEQLTNETYDLVITDLGREGHPTVQPLPAPGSLSIQSCAPAAPVIVYAGTWAVAQRDNLVRRGALDVMANREHLFATVLAVLGRSPQPADELQR